MKQYNKQRTLLWRKAYFLISPGEAPLAIVGSLFPCWRLWTDWHWAPGSAWLRWVSASKALYCTICKTNWPPQLPSPRPGSAWMRWVSDQPPSHSACCCTFCNIGRGTTVWLRGNAADNIWEIHFARFRQIWPGSVWTRWIQKCTIIGTELVFTLVLKVWRLKTKS